MFISSTLNYEMRSPSPYQGMRQLLKCPSALRSFPKLRPNPWQALRVTLLEEPDQLLADITAKVPGRGGIWGAHERTQFHSSLRCIRDLKCPYLSIPHFGSEEKTVELYANFFYRDVVIGVK